MADRNKSPDFSALSEFLVGTAAPVIDEPKISCIYRVACTLQVKKDSLPFSLFNISYRFHDLEAPSVKFAFAQVLDGQTIIRWIVLLPKFFAAGEISRSHWLIVRNQRFDKLLCGFHGFRIRCDN